MPNTLTTFNSVRTIPAHQLQAAQIAVLHGRAIYKLLPSPTPWIARHPFPIWIPRSGSLSAARQCQEKGGHAALAMLSGCLLGRAFRIISIAMPTHCVVP